MGWASEKQIKDMEKESRRQQYLEDNPHLLTNSCKNSFPGGKCTSGSKQGDYCDNDNPSTCPYND